jgi:hypothetical protein
VSGLSQLGHEWHTACLNVSGPATLSRLVARVVCSVLFCDLRVAAASMRVMFLHLAPHEARERKNTHRRDISRAS